ncbi:hypothetical protein CCR97_07915 [Rhodoplanes elegans]|uniref:Tyr recombinase domain-containing protein n=1 Tax=Rhodoplanes elegans TaxID=29408 RepID=A0A327KRW0_9BRAD|nr:tyrosine-type recombinase/integrase [Rhodoplanes elegans]MBK5958136.1 hypothetical protein [Rhodoplanes elegans]RAI40423.1 hypothetical protein CH338_06165 [Rhodoplanes elegans]
MALRLRPPRLGRTPNWEIRGTHRGIAVERSAGSPDRRIAERRLREVEREIEAGEWSTPPAPRHEPTFADAVEGYVRAGRRRKYLLKLLDRFGDTPLSGITQAEIDRAAVELYPAVQPQTRNTCFYTPLSAVLRHAGVDRPIRRPKGAKGRVVTRFLTQPDAFAIIREADQIDARLGLLLRLLLYTGMRINEALRLRWEDIDLAGGTAYVGLTKTGEARTAKLRADLVAQLRAIRPETGAGRVFQFAYGGRLKDQFLRAKLAVCDVPMPPRGKKGQRRPRLDYRLAWVNFHTFRHTWATWMRMYGGADVQGLVATGNWSDPRSAARYAHVVPRDEWCRVDDLPGEPEG